jgi:trans-2,3-dihydro-3-hydroxyanthranilate isomerase
MPVHDTSIHVAIYDVFAERPYSGNQAAVVRLGRVRFSDSQLIKLAQELSLAETALLSMQGETLSLRFATADRLVNRCGHATLAGVADHVYSALFSGASRGEASGRYRVGSSAAEWRARVRGGRTSHDGPPGIDVAVQWPERPRFVAPLPARTVYQTLGLTIDDAPLDLPRCIYDSGNLNALVPVRSIARLRRARPDWLRLRTLFEKFRLTDLHLYCLRDPVRPSQSVRLQCRNLFPYGVFEEPATGTASVALAAALVDHVHHIQTDRRGVRFRFDQGVGKRLGRIIVDWGPGADPAIWLKGRVFPTLNGKLTSIPPG